MALTNYDRWMSISDRLPSPQNFRDWGWISLVGASLQRRVWLSATSKPCFANAYIILVGPPGVGKGLVIDLCSDLLKHWKKEDYKPNTNTLSEGDKSIVDAVAESDLKTQQEQELQSKNKQADMAKPLLFPVAADATTYEALVQAVANAYSRINYLEFSEKAGKEILKIYGHSSIAFQLQELASLMRKRTDDTVNYMLGLYDCPVDYEYITITRGKDRVRRGCLNLLAGTTPSFMQSTFNDKLVGEGFTSRVFYIFAPKNRKNVFALRDWTPEEVQHRKELLEHIMKLSTLYGSVKVDKETQEFLEHWWDTTERNKHLRTNTSLQLVPYYARKNIHVMKVAMALHFGESTEMFIPKETFKKAIEILEKEEKSMHLAITLESNNPASRIAKKILEYLAGGEKCWVDIWCEMNTMGARKDIEESITFLTETDQIKVVERECSITKKNILHWMIK